MGDTTGLLQTVAVLAACVVYLAKQAHESYRMRKNGRPETNGMDSKTTRQLEDIHDWLRPVADPSSGQPRFNYYCGAAQMASELAELHKSVVKMNKCLDAMLREMKALREDREAAAKRRGDSAA